MRASYSKDLVEGGTSLLPTPTTSCWSLLVLLEEDQVLLSLAWDLEVGAGGMLAQRPRCKFCSILLPLAGPHGALACVTAAWALLLKIQSDSAGAGAGVWVPRAAPFWVDSEPSWGGVDPSFTLPRFFWKNPCTVMSGTGSQAKLAGLRFQVS